MTKKRDKSEAEDSKNDTFISSKPFFEGKK
jgi:hypothetical protein